MGGGAKWFLLWLLITKQMRPVRREHLMLNPALMVFVRKYCTLNRGVLSNALIHAGLSSR